MYDCLPVHLGRYCNQHAHAYLLPACSLKNRWIDGEDYRGNQHLGELCTCPEPPQAAPTKNGSKCVKGYAPSLMVMSLSKIQPSESPLLTASLRELTPILE